MQTTTTQKIIVFTLEFTETSFADLPPAPLKRSFI